MDLKPSRKRIALVLGGAAVITAGTIGGAAAIAGDDDARERPIPAAQLERAERAALDETGGGTVTETEVDDEESKYEVEVTLPDGAEVDVQLDENFRPVDTERDADGPDGTED